MNPAEILVKQAEALEEAARVIYSASVHGYVPLAAINHLKNRAVELRAQARALASPQPSLSSEGDVKKAAPKKEHEIWPNSYASNAPEQKLG